MSREFLKQRIEATKNIIIEYETAILTLNTTSAISYTLNTSQTTQTVTKRDVAGLQASLNGLYNTLATLEARLTGNGVIIAGPAW